MQNECRNFSGFSSCSPWRDIGYALTVYPVEEHLKDSGVCFFHSIKFSFPHESTGRKKFRIQAKGRDEVLVFGENYLLESGKDFYCVFSATGNSLSARGLPSV